MSVTGVAALIAAVSFAVIAGAVLYLAVRLTRVLGEATTLVRETRAEQQAVLARASAAVDRANAQLDRTDAVVASMDELGAGVSELAGQVSTLAGLGRALAAGPVGRAAAVAYGVRHAVALRRAPGRLMVVRGVSGGSSPLKQAELPGQIVNGAKLPSAGRTRRAVTR
jgi:uncharacterized protein YoxC